jgi:hypothetical protein
LGFKPPRERWRFYLWLRREDRMNEGKGRMIERVDVREFVRFGFKSLRKQTALANLCEFPMIIGHRKWTHPNRI